MLSLLRSHVLILALACHAVLCPAQPAHSVFPDETDTIHIGVRVTLAQIRGEVFRKETNGELVAISSGATVEPGDVIFVTMGASFSIGRTRFGPEYHGDRWVQFE